MEAMTVFDGSFVTACRKQLASVLMDGLQHGESRLDGKARHPLHEALIEQSGQTGKDIDGRWIRDCLGGLDRPALGKDAESDKELLLLRRQEIVAPGDSGADGLLPFRSIPGPSAELQQSRRQPLQECRRSEETRPRGGQFYGQRETVETATDQGDDLGIRFAYGEVASGGAGTFGKEADGRHLRELLERRYVSGIRYRQRRHLEDVLTVDMEQRPARHQELQCVTGEQQVSQQRG